MYIYIYRYIHDTNFVLPVFKLFLTCVKRDDNFIKITNIFYHTVSFLRTALCIITFCFSSFLTIYLFAFKFMIEDLFWYWQKSCFISPSNKKLSFYNILFSILFQHAKQDYFFLYFNDKHYVWLDYKVKKFLRLLFDVLNIVFTCV